VIVSETISRQASTKETFNFLRTGLRRASVEALDSISMIGSATTDLNEPFVIIRSYNFDVLFSGMLAWEPFIYDDFTPLFGSQELRSISFVDAVQNNTSIRILYDEEGNEILLYAFVNRNTVVITTSSEALSKIIERF
jgi:hypothetical protein